MNWDLLAGVTIGAAVPALVASLWTFLKVLLRRREEVRSAETQSQMMSRVVDAHAMTEKELDQILSELEDVTGTLRRERASRGGGSGRPAAAHPF